MWSNVKVLKKLAEMCPFIVGAIVTSWPFSGSTLAIFVWTLNLFVAIIITFLLIGTNQFESQLGPNWPFIWENPLKTQNWPYLKKCILKNCVTSWKITPTDIFKIAVKEREGAKSLKWNFNLGRHFPNKIGPFRTFWPLLINGDLNQNSTYKSWQLVINCLK